jgi:hypothetical protein
MGQTLKIGGIGLYEDFNVAKHFEESSGTSDL